MAKVRVARASGKTLSIQKQVDKVSDAGIAIYLRKLCKKQPAVFAELIASIQSEEEKPARVKARPKVAIATTKGSSAKIDAQMGQPYFMGRMRPMNAVRTEFDLGMVGDPSTDRTLEVEMIVLQGQYYIRLAPEFPSHRIEMSTAPDGAILVRLQW